MIVRSFTHKEIGLRHKFSNATFLIMPRLSKDDRNALRRARHKEKKKQNKEKNIRILNKKKFDEHWNNLEKNRAKSRKCRDERKRREAQEA